MAMAAQRTGVSGEGVPSQVGDARGEIHEKMRGRLDDLASLIRLRDTSGAVAAGDHRQFEGLGVEFDDGDSLEDQAISALNEYPLAVESTTVFEVVLGTGGPDDRLLFECHSLEGTRLYGGGSQASVSYDIDRVHYRYSWTDSAEVELVGEDRETAEEFGRYVIPELVA